MKNIIKHYPLSTSEYWHEEWLKGNVVSVTAYNKEVIVKHKTMITPTSEFWKIFKETNGALSCTEAVAIMNIAAQAPEGLYLELGTHLGKSAISALQTLKNEVFFAIDPIFEDEDIYHEVEQKLLLANPSVAIEMINGYSPKDIPNYEYSYVFVDSGVHDDTVMDEVKFLEDRIVPNGIIAFHDYLNQFTAVERAYNYLVGTGKYEPIKINWQEIFDYVAEHNLEEGNNSWHLYPELPHPPNFVGAVKRI